nr:FAD-binding oxidoreductase [Paraflavitalea speifideiaquila]
MERDGNCQSLWQSSLPDYRARANYIPVGIQDVLIVGGGITGISTALRLQQWGKQCVLVEAHNIGFGSTGGTTAHLNTFMDSSYGQIAKNFSGEDAQLMAGAVQSVIDLIKGNIGAFDIHCKFKELPGYLFSVNEKQSTELGEIVTATQKVGVGAGFINDSPFPMPYKEVALFENQAQFNPLQYLYGLAKAFEEAGGVLLQNCRMLHATNNETIEVVTTKGNIKCRQMVYATHIPPGVNLLHFRCAPYRSYAIAVQLKDGYYPEGVAYDMEDPYHYYRCQEVNGEQYLIVGGEDHKTGHEENTEACFRRLESHVRNFLRSRR